MIIGVCGFSDSCKNIVREILVDKGFKHLLYSGEHSLEIEIPKYDNVVITDVRLLDEFKKIKDLDGYIFEVVDRQPVWWWTAYNELTGVIEAGTMKKLYPEVHISEWGWICSDYIDSEIYYTENIEELKEDIESYIELLNLV